MTFLIVVSLFTIFFLIWGLSKDCQLSSHRNIFLLVSTYYALCVPLDSLFGIQLFTSESIDFVDLNLFKNRHLIIYISTLYFLLISSFMLSYSKFNFKEKLKNINPWYKKVLPHVSTIILLNLLILIANFFIFKGTTRTDKALIIKGDFVFKLLSLGTVILFNLNSLYILLTTSKKHSLYITILSCISVLATGGRTTVIYFIILFMYKNRVSINLKSKLLSVPLFFGFVFFFKGTYNNILNVVKGYPLSPFLSKEYVIGFSRFEGIMSYSITSTVIEKLDMLSPMFLGKTYLESLKFIALRGSYLNAPETLAEKYMQILAPTVWSEGGGIAFSGILEAWLNFGLLGPLIAGISLGLLAKYFDNNRFHILTPISLMVMIRFCRSDFSSMFKRFFIINGVCITILLIVMYMYFILFIKNKESNTAST